MSGKTRGVRAILLLLAVGLSVVNLPASLAAAQVTNTPPVANDDAATTHQPDDVVIDVLANDTDADGDALSIPSFTQGANGSVFARSQLSRARSATPRTPASSASTPSPTPSAMGRRPTRGR